MSKPNPTKPFAWVICAVNTGLFPVGKSGDVTVYAPGERLEHRGTVKATTRKGALILGRKQWSDTRLNAVPADQMY